MLLDNIDYKVYRQVQCFSYQNSLVETIKSETTMRLQISKSGH